MSDTGRSEEEMTAMEYDYHEGFKSRTWILLHGSGGSREDLLPFARMVDSEASIIALEGDVDEEGLRRFFRRKGPGIPDEDDLKQRTDRLHRFLDELAERHDLDRDGFLAMGYSNGANMIASLLVRHGSAFKAAFLLHPMCPYRKMPFCDVTGTEVFISAGKRDTVIPEEEPQCLYDHLVTCGVSPMIHWHTEGHKITMGEMREVCRFYRKRVFPSFYDQ